MHALRIFVFVGAFLLFAMEPMVGRLLLPDFGGAFHVWTTSLMFFQGALFVGYLYAHLGAEKARALHLAVLALPLVFLPPGVGDASGGDVVTLLAQLALHIAVPFSVLATTGVVAQGWLARSSLEERKSPWFLYAISNAGSLLALLAYALLIEPFIGVSVQRWAWALGYVVYLASALFAYRATHTTRSVAATATHEEKDPEPLRAGRIAYWLVLSACPSIFLMAVTNLIALDAGNVPLVWVVPLALYLLTFILAFAEPSRVPDGVRRLWPHFAAVGLFFFAGGDTGGTWAQAILQLVVMFVLCLAAHAELYASRPSPRHLTAFYLVIALGGWIGGAFVALGAPLFFSGLYEYPIPIVLLAVAMGIANRHAILAWAKGPGRFGVIATLGLALAIGWKLASGGMGGAAAGSVRTLEVRRSFYGIYYVLERPTSRGIERDLVSGTTRHGRQFMADDLRGEPLSYYHRTGPLGDAMAVLAERGRPRHIGVVGLGVGAAAAYVEAGESIDFYEIDQAVIDIAQEHFRYLPECRGEVTTIVGDARLSLARRATSAERYDLLLIDAFAGDAIPTHLLTREAVELYRAQLAPGGVLLFHISNRYYDLHPVLATLAREGWDEPIIAGTRENLSPLDREAADPSEYFVMVGSEAELAPFEARGFEAIAVDRPARTSLWTDDHANTLSALLADWE